MRRHTAFSEQLLKHIFSKYLAHFDEPLNQQALHLRNCMVMYEVLLLLGLTSHDEAWELRLPALDKW